MARPVEPVRPQRPRICAGGVRPIAQYVEEGILPGGSRPLRAVVIGDCDFASNSFFPYMSNSDLLLAAVRWLAREERTTAVATRIPVPSLVLLTQSQARAVFVLVAGLLPLMIIALGGLVWWQRR